MRANKKKVIFVIHRLTHGGVQHSLFKLLNHIDYNNNDVDLLVLENKAELKNEINSNVNVVICENVCNYEKNFVSLFFLFLSKVCKSLNFKSLYEKLNRFQTSYIYNKKYKYINKKYIKKLPEYDVAVSYIQSYPSIVAAEYIKADKKIMFYHSSVDELHDVNEKIIDKYDSVVAVNSAVAGVIKKAYPHAKEKVEVLDIFVDYKEIREKAKAEDVKFNTDCVNIVSCGRLSKEKGYDLAVRASSLLAKSNIKFHWYFVGDGPEREMLEDLIKTEKLEGYITITGFKNNPFPYVKSCDIFVQSSYLDANPLTIEEAKMLCKPIVSTRTLGGKFMIEEGETGITSEINAEDLSKQIRFLIENPKMMNKIVDNLEKISYENQDEEYTKSIENILSRLKNE